MRDFEVPGTSWRIRFHDLPGNDPPLMLVHGLGCASSCDYPRIAADPALAGRRMLLVDLLGAGFSDKPAGFGYAVEDHAETLRALMRGLSLPVIDLFGHSMGGAIAIETATRNHGRIRRLVLGEPNLCAGGGDTSRSIAAYSEDDYVARGHEETTRNAAAAGDTTWSASALLWSPAAVHRGATSLVRGGAPSWMDQLGALPIPRTVIFGESSLPDPNTERLPRIGVAVRIVRDAGHSMAWENPSGVAEAISAALSG